jgi:hypothetical protein
MVSVHIRANEELPSQGADVVASGSRVDWQQGQDALRDEVARVVALLRSIQDPGPHAVGQWNLGEVAAHLSHAWVVIPALASRDLSGVDETVPGFVDAAGDSLIQDMGDLADATVLGVRSDPERDLAVLADRIEAQAKEYFSDCAGADPDAPRPWLVHGTTVRQSTLTYHLLNETLMHAYDIAQAAGRPWRVEPAHAAMVLGRFIVPLLQTLDAHAMVNGAKAAGRQATYDVRIRGGDSFYFIFDDGALEIAEPSSRRVDCHISADPVAFLMVVWARQSQWAAIGKGKLMAWGRKPWLGPQLRSLIRNP